MLNHRELSEGVNTILESPGLKHAIIQGFSPALNEWKESLLYNVDMEESRRKGYVIALRKVKEVLTDLWGNAGKTPPNWLEELF
jgi:hypothetical protein